jgi:hypothetical protein
MPNKDTKTKETSNPVDKVTSSSKVLKYSNFNSFSIPYAAYNLDMLDTDGNEEDHRSLLFDFTIRVRPSMLLQQSQVFADQIYSNNKIDFRSICSSNNFEEQMKFLRHTYIYSFCKAYLYGCAKQSALNIPVDSFVFKGHAFMYSLLKYSSFDSDNFDNISIRNRLLISEDIHEDNIRKLTQAFDFLKNFNSSEGIRFSIPRYDRILNQLKHLQNTSWVDIIDISSRGESELSQMIEPTSNPFGNSCYSSDHKYFHFVPTNHQVDDVSFAINKAIFLTHLKFDSPDEINSWYYTTKPYNRNFIKYEVRSVCNLIPKRNPSSGLNLDNITAPIPSPDKDDDPNPDNPGSG